MTDRSEKIQELITTALRQFEKQRPRTQQSAAGILGPSDIGFCRQKAVLMTKGVAATDDPPMWAAAVGTAIHTYVEGAIKEIYPDWLVGSIDNIRVTATLPSGAEISGHPDVVVPSANAILDIKTVDGFEFVKRDGTSKSHKFQRHLYAMGLIQAGILTEDKPVLVGNIYFDRSGKQPKPIVLAEEMDPTLTSEIDSWIQDVVYAVTNNEDASRDVPAAVCEKICSHFTACRGALEVFDGAETITNPELVSAVEMYLDGRDLERRGARMKDEAKSRLYGVNGVTQTHQVRWVEVAPTVISASERDGYLRMDIVKLRK